MRMELSVHWHKGPSPIPSVKGRSRPRRTECERLDQHNVYRAAGPLDGQVDAHVSARIEDAENGPASEELGRHKIGSHAAVVLEHDGSVGKHAVVDVGGCGPELAVAGVAGEEVTVFKIAGASLVAADAADLKACFGHLFFSFPS